MEADAYPDSSFLVSLHRADAHQAAARSFVGRSASSLAFTPLHRLEVRNALRNAVSFGDMEKSDCLLAIRQIDEDLRDRILIHTVAEWTNVFRRADELSEQYAARGGQRTIDLLHVAMALECAADTFLSFDRRQRRLAEAVGLRVRP